MTQFSCISSVAWLGIQLILGAPRSSCNMYSHLNSFCCFIMHKNLLLYRTYASANYHLVYELQHLKTNFETQWLLSNINSVARRKMKIWNEMLGLQADSRSIGPYDRILIHWFTFYLANCASLLSDTFIYYETWSQSSKPALKKWNSLNFMAVSLGTARVHARKRFLGILHKPFCRGLIYYDFAPSRWMLSPDSPRKLH